MESEIQQAGFRLHRINAIRGESAACKKWVAKRDSQFKLLGRRLNLKEERKLLTELIQNFPEIPHVRYILDIERDSQALGYRRRQVCHLRPVNHQLCGRERHCLLQRHQRSLALRRRRGGAAQNVVKSQA